MDSVKRKIQLLNTRYRKLAERMNGYQSLGAEHNDKITKIEGDMDKIFWTILLMMFAYLILILHVAGQNG